MTSIEGPPEVVNSILGLPEERWFHRLSESRDWTALGVAPRADRHDTEAVFRAIWALSSKSLRRSMPNEFYLDEKNLADHRITAPALRAIGAAAIADLIEGPQPKPLVYPPSPDTTGMTREEAREADIAAQPPYEDRAVWRQFHRQVNDACQPIRDRLIAYLRARGVFPLESPRKVS